MVSWEGNENNWPVLNFKITLQKMVYLINIIVNEYLDINDIDHILNAQNF